MEQEDELQNTAETAVPVVENAVTDFLTKEVYSLGGKGIDMLDLFIAIILAILAVVVYQKGIRKILGGMMQVNNVDPGRQYAVLQLLMYFFYFIAFVVVLKFMGIDLSLLLVGSSALLIGFGIGLQHLFNDIVSGFLLLFGGSVQVGDVVNVDEMLGTVKKIGLRTSEVETIDRIKVLIPNSKFISENVVNWSHDNRIARFHVDVGVAYGSDLSVVKNCLLESAATHHEVLKNPKPAVQLRDFGDSSLNFRLYFCTNNFLGSEQIKSDVRFIIEKQFRSKNIEIPFPQTVFHSIPVAKIEKKESKTGGFGSSNISSD